jgi:hypothetical protein
MLCQVPCFFVLSLSRPIRPVPLRYETGLVATDDDDDDDDDDNDDDDDDDDDDEE